LRLVDEYVRIKEELDELRRDAEEKLDKLREALIAFCEREEVSVVFGFDSKITVKESEYVKLPAKNSDERKELNEVLRGIGKLDDVSELDVHVLARILKNKEWAEEELGLLREFWEMEKSYRLSVSKK